LTLLIKLGKALPGSLKINIEDSHLDIRILMLNKPSEPHGVFAAYLGAIAMTFISGADTLDEGNVFWLLSICGKFKIAFTIKNPLQVKASQDIRISAVTQRANFSGVKDFEAGGDDNCADTQFLPFRFKVKSYSGRGTYSLTEVALLTSEAKASSFIDDITIRDCFGGRWKDCLGLSRTNLSTHPTSDASFWGNVLGLSKHLDLKISDFAAYL